MPKELRGIFLTSQLFGLARYLCTGIDNHVIASDSGAQAIVNALHQRYELTVISEIFRDLKEILSTRRGSNESLRGVESRFAAQMSKFNSLDTRTKLPESLTALMLLANASVENTQRV